MIIAEMFVVSIVSLCNRTSIESFAKNFYFGYDRFMKMKWWGR